MTRDSNDALRSLDVLVDAPAPADVAEVIERGLAEHASLAGVPSRVERSLSVVARGSDSSLLGALLGRTVWGWLHVRELWVAPDHRRQGYTSFGKLDDFPKGHERYFLQKRLVTGSAAWAADSL